MNLSKKQVIKSRLLFVFSFLQFKYFLFRNRSKIEYLKADSNKGDFIVVLTPWQFNSTCWFSIVVGLILYRRGNTVSFLIDDLVFEDSKDHFFQIKMIKLALAFTKKLNITVKNLSECNSNVQISEEEHTQVYKLAYANTVHKNRGEEDTELFQKMVLDYNKLLSRNFQYIKAFVKENDQQSYYVAGGIYGNTGLFSYILKQTEMHYFTFDSGFAVLLACYRGIAAQFTDIPQALQLMLTEKEQKIAKAVAFAKEEFNLRKSGTNKLVSQYQAYSESEILEKVGILIPLNSPWDSAALNISSVFDGYNNWLLETIAIILDNSSMVITIRQHPDERHWWGRTKTDFNLLIEGRFGKNERIQFVSCWDKVNSYVLLEKAEAVVCYSSTFGIEAAMAGKAVCVCSHVYYSGLDFVFKPKKATDISYFINNVDSVLMSFKDKELSYMVYYLGQKCNWLFTEFTPAMHDFKKWYKSDINDIESDSAIVTYIESLENNLPVSFVNFKTATEAIN